MEAVAERARVVPVSPEMVSILGPGSALGDVDLPRDLLALSFRSAGMKTPETIACLGRVRRRELTREIQTGAFLVLAPTRAAVRRLGGEDLLERTGVFHAPAALRTVALALLSPKLTQTTHAPYQIAKSIELLCEIIHASRAGELVPASCDRLSAADTRRIIAAKRMVDERWTEKLTLNAIARACGLNRTKLTRGFRDAFGTSVAESLAELRLTAAGRMLLTTDLPVSTIGYETGYLNTASFTRAFGRRYGHTPSDYRVRALAA